MEDETRGKLFTKPGLREHMRALVRKKWHAARLALEGKWRAPPGAARKQLKFTFPFQARSTTRENETLDFTSASRRLAPNMCQTSPSMTLAGKWLVRFAGGAENAKASRRRMDVLLCDGQKNSTKETISVPFGPFDQSSFDRVVLLRRETLRRRSRKRERRDTHRSRFRRRPALS